MYLERTYRAGEGILQPALFLRNHGELEDPGCPTARPSTHRPQSHRSNAGKPLVPEDQTDSGHMEGTSKHFLVRDWIILGWRIATQGPSVSDGLAQNRETWPWARGPPAKQQL